MKRFICILVGISLLQFLGCDRIERVQTYINEETTHPKTYIEIINTDVKPGISTDYEFPLSAQYQNGCFAFGVKHIVKHKYDIDIDPYKVEKEINKPRSELWTIDHISNFLNKYDLKLRWFTDAETFFDLLKKGEPVLIQYKYPIADNKWIGHFVAVYSFDKEGVWIAESISNTRTKILYTDIFDTTGLQTQFSFATIDIKEAN